MVTILYRVLIKPEQVSPFKRLSQNVLVPEAQKLSGCEHFSLHQDINNEREFMFYEKWDSEASVEQYKKNLVAILGDPRPGEEFPEAMNALIEQDEDLI